MWGPMTLPDVYVVGAGLFGLTFAQRAASKWGQRVQVMDRRDHVGGNAFSETDARGGIEVHRYGAHIFHTNNERVWDYVRRFSAFTRYEHRVFTKHAGMTYPMPINLQTINQFFGRSFSAAEARRFVRDQAGTAAPLLCSYAQTV